jgi:hypothetical protein
VSVDWDEPKPRWSEEAQASAALLEGVNAAIGRFADKWKITDDEARTLLLNTGVRLPC